MLGFTRPRVKVIRVLARIQRTVLSVACFESVFVSRRNRILINSLFQDARLACIPTLLLLKWQSFVHLFDLRGHFNGFFPCLFNRLLRVAATGVAHLITGRFLKVTGHLRLVFFIKHPVHLSLQELFRDILARKISLLYRRRQALPETHTYL